MRVNLIVNQGETFETTFTVLDGDAAKNLANYSATAYFRKHYSSNSYFSFTTEVGASNGTITLSMTPTQTTAVPYGRYFYDCVITSNTGAPTLRPFEGTVTITPGVPR